MADDRLLILIHALIPIRAAWTITPLRPQIASPLLSCCC
jgi:hypothetical protein